MHRLRVGIGGGLALNRQNRNREPQSIPSQSAFGTLKGQGMTSVGFVIVAGGRGTRFGSGMAKQYLSLHGKPVLNWSVQAALAHHGTHLCVVVHPEGDAEQVCAALGQTSADPRLKLCEGGADRAGSVTAGLSTLAAHGDKIEAVLIHDAARPGLDQRTISALLDALKTHDGAAPSLSVSDAIKRQDNAQNLQSIDRSRLYRVQTPQAFRLSRYREAMAAWPKDRTADDDLTIAQAHGLTLTLVPGSESLGKITFPSDLEKLRTLMSSSEHTSQPLSDVRTGHGIDVHAFCEGDHVILAGVAIPHIARLEGHSDADAAWHALTDAILGAASLGDIGDHFPPTDPQWKGANSAVFLKAAVDLVRKDGWSLAHVDITILCEAPKIKPHRLSMRQATAILLNLTLDQVSVKATTTESLGFLGRREGIGAMATATLHKR